MHACGNCTTAVKLSITCTLLVFGYYYWRCNITQELQRYKGQRGGHFTLEFVPRPPARFADCDDLFTGSTPVDKYNMSSHYWSHYPEFQKELRKHTNGRLFWDENYANVGAALLGCTTINCQHMRNWIQLGTFQLQFFDGQFEDNNYCTFIRYRFAQLYESNE